LKSRLPRALGAALLASTLGVHAAPTVDVRAELTEVLAQEGLGGATWSLVTPEHGVVAGAAGTKDARTRETLAADSRMHVGSIAKTVLAAGVLRLVTEGRLALDAPVEGLLPLRFDNPWAATDPVRLRHLLDHTSGLDDARLWQVFSLVARADSPLAAAFDRDASLLRVRVRPGSRASYSNMGYALAGMVIESIAAERYEEYLDARVLKPLGMHDSTARFVTQSADPRLAMGHFENGRGQAAVPLYLRPGSQLTTTAGDMATFARFLMGDGRVDGKPFIDEALLRAMGTPVHTEAARAGLEIGYALGLARRDRHGASGRCHGGSTVGFRAMLCTYPEQRKAYFYALNTDSETARHERIDAIFIRSLGLAATATPPAAAPMDGISRWDGFYVPAPSRFASFEWLDRVASFTRVRWDGARLHLEPAQSGPRTLVPAGGALFRAADRKLPSHALIETPEGGRVLTDGLQSHERVSWLAMTLFWANLGAGLIGLAYLLVIGAARMARRRMPASHPSFVPVLAVAALLLPLPFFFRQSFLQLGDLTLASGLLALVTTALPFAMVTGLVLHFRERAGAAWATLDIAAMLAVLQWAIVLAAWGLLPLRLWG